MIVLFTDEAELSAGDQENEKHSRHSPKHRSPPPGDRARQQGDGAELQMGRDHHDSRAGVRLQSKEEVVCNIRSGVSRWRFDELAIIMAWRSYEPE